ncbi:hypothetical protein ASG76_00945 [Nocardioides sp. Soil774]|nr:hypothetical protein ASG76_00945 [Nocardioides sp. Soil774]
MAVSTETNVGGLNLGPGLNLSHAAPVTSGIANRQTLTISFDRAVTGLSFWLTDIDSTLNGSGTKRDPYAGWWDRVALSGTYTQSRDALVLGSGTTADPWYFDDPNTNVGNESGGARVKVTYPGTIAAGDTITLQYWTTQSDGNQRIFLSDLSWTARGC